MDANELKGRTKKFAVEIIRLVYSLQKNEVSIVISRQLLRSATSVGANYRAACRARSKKEFISKMKIVEEEADETLYWLELLSESPGVDEKRLIGLSKEANELTAIFTAIGRTARINLKNKTASKKAI